MVSFTHSEIIDNSSDAKNRVHVCVWICTCLFGHASIDKLVYRLFGFTLALVVL